MPLSLLIYIPTSLVCLLQGHPFMLPLRQHKKFFNTIIVLYVVCFAVAAEFPGLGELMEMVPFPSDEFRYTLLTYMALDTGLVIGLERAIRMLQAALTTTK